MGQSCTPPDELPFEEPERWLPVPGYEGLYDASDLGHVRSLPRTTACGIRGGQLLGTGRRGRYTAVTLFRNGKRDVWSLHVLILTVFCGPRPEGRIGCHGPGGSQDNRLENLYWGTYDRNNGPDRHRDGTAFVGEVNNKARLTKAIVLEIRARYVAGESCAAMSRDYGVSTSTVDRVIHGKTWQHLGLPPVPIHPICGEANARSKLTAAIVTDIRTRYAAGGTSQADLRREYGLSSGGISRIINRIDWKHLP